MDYRNCLSFVFSVLPLTLEPISYGNVCEVFTLASPTLESL